MRGLRVSIDPIWEETFRKRDWGRYPNEELVRFVARNFAGVPDRSQVKILEIGCASANNVWFMAREGYSAFGIDGSSTVIERGRVRLAGESVTADLRVGDATRLGEVYSEGTFDAVIDVGCLQCNRLGDVRDIVRQMGRLCKPGGKVFSLIVADDAIGNGRGTFVEPGTFSDITVGPLRGTGLNHFFSASEIQDVFSPFAPLAIEYVSRSYENRDQVYKTWVVTGAKA